MGGVNYGPIKPTKMAAPKMGTPTKMIGGPKGAVTKPQKNPKTTMPKGVAATKITVAKPKKTTVPMPKTIAKMKRIGPGSRGMISQPRSPKGLGRGFDGLGDIG